MGWFRSSSSERVGTPSTALMEASPRPAMERDVEEASIVRVGEDCYVWDVDLVQELRERHRVVGAMVGGVAGFKQQDAVRGLPLQLLPAEEEYLRKRKAIDPVCLEGEYTAERRPGKEVEIASDEDESKVKTIPLSCTFTSQWVYKHQKKANDGEEWACAGDERERRKVLVYADLQRLGMHVTSGLKFGADFLAYPGDPALFHAQFIVRVVQDDEPLHVLGLSGCARVAHSARKHLLLASIEEKGGETLIHYLTLGPDGGFNPQIAPN
eukprot:scaffold363_cov331-Pavlova_lutheri.AAC.106